MIKYCDKTPLYLGGTVSVHMCFGCTIWPSHWDGSFEHQQYIYFCWEIKLIITDSILSRDQVWLYYQFMREWRSADSSPYRHQPATGVCDQSCSNQPDQPLILKFCTTEISKERLSNSRIRLRMRSLVCALVRVQQNKVFSRPIQ